MFLLASDYDYARSVALVALGDRGHVSLFNRMRLNRRRCGAVFRLNGGDLGRHQRLHRRTTAGGIGNLADLELYIAIWGYENLRLSGYIVSVVVTNTGLAADQLGSFALGIVLDWTSAGNAFLYLFRF